MRFKQSMPSKVDKRYRRYDPESLLKAYKAVTERGMKTQTAAKKFGVPAQTLRDRVKGYIDPTNFAIGGETLLSREEEEVLVEHCETMADLGYGYRHTMLQSLAGELAFDFRKKTNNKPLSNNWLRGFLHRWGDRISSLSPHKLDSTRAKCATPETVQKYYNNLGDTLRENDLLSKPQCIFNLDESGISPEHCPPNIIGNPKSKPQAITSPRSTTTTVIGCVNALGHALPPYFIFKGKRWNPDLMKGATTGAKGTMSESGWTNSDIFQDYLKTHFLPYVRPEGSQHKVMLIYDGHTSHKTPEVIRWAKEQNVILFVLPAHASHLLQPLDVCIFGPFKRHYYAECASYMYRNMGQTISRYDMCAIACKAYAKAMSPMNIMSGFKKTGIFPFEPNAVPKEKFLPCENFRTDKPVQKAKAIKSGREAVEEFLRIQEESKQKLSQTEEPSSTCPSVKKPKTSIRPNASGTAITDDTYIQELQDYARNKENVRPKQKDTKGKQPLKARTPAHKKSASPKPSCSGLHLKKTTPKQLIYDTDTEDDDDDDDDECCCVCNRRSPQNIDKFPQLKIINWASCDKCEHWVHLAYCTPVRVVRRHASFLCPHCDTI